MRLLQRQADAVDLGVAQGQQRRARGGVVEEAQQMQRSLHPVVDVAIRGAVEDPAQRLQAGVDAPRRRQVAAALPRLARARGWRPFTSFAFVIVRK